VTKANTTDLVLWLDVQTEDALEITIENATSSMPADKKTASEKSDKNDITR